MPGHTDGDAACCHACPIEEATPTDFALWVDELEPSVGNPFLIEVKRSIVSRSDIDVLASRFAETSPRWARLLYLGLPSEKLLGDLLPPNILHLPIRQDTVPQISPSQSYQGREQHLVLTATQHLKAKRTPAGRQPKPTKPHECWGIDMTKVLVEAVG
jgi:hypothetical protein